MSDRELLEAAARAAGIESRGHHPAGGVQYRKDGLDWVFDPLRHDGDAFRLAVRLDLCVGLRKCWRPYNDESYVYVGGEDDESLGFISAHGAATRRAIVTVAAAIGAALAPIELPKGDA